MKERSYSESSNDNYSSGYTNPCDNYYSPSHTYTPFVGGGYYKTCKCCCGTGVQTRCDGIRICCPCCNGTGKRWVPCKRYSPPYPCFPQRPKFWCITTSNNSSGKFT